MPRDLPLANGRMLVNFDFSYRVRDVYWPHVGERNHTDGHINHFGVWVDGAFVWADDAEWSREMRYQDDTLVTAVKLMHERLNLALTCSDTVDFDRDALIRRVRISNNAAVARAVPRSSTTTGTSTRARAPTTSISTLSAARSSPIRTTRTYWSADSSAMRTPDSRRASAAWPSRWRSGRRAIKRLTASKGHGATPKMAS